MKSIMFFFSIVIVLFLSATLQAQITNIEVGGKKVKISKWKGIETKHISGELVLQIKSKKDEVKIKEKIKEKGGIVIKGFDNLGWGLIEIPSGTDEINAINEMTNIPGVVNIELNVLHEAGIAANDPYYQGISPASYPYQWALKNTGQTPPSGSSGADIAIEKAWDITTGDPDIIIAMLDSGIPLVDGALSHPDLNDNSKFILGPDYIDVPGTPEYSEGVRDQNGHGTTVTGIAGAKSNNNTGIAGIAWNCKILVIQVFNKNRYGNDDSFYEGVIYAVDYQLANPGKKVIINYTGISDLGTATQRAALSYAEQHGVPIIISAGNGGPIKYPAAYSGNFSNIIAVSATTADDVRADYSSTGSSVCVAAPGGYNAELIGNVVYFNSAAVLGKNIFTTSPNYPYVLQWDPISANDQYTSDMTLSYTYVDGTSIAAPHVSGLAALVYSINKNLTASDIRTIIEQSADKIDAAAHPYTNGKNNYYGYGRINAYKAIKYTIENYGGSISQSFSIPYGEIWNLQPGIQLNFNAGVNITVNGTFNAIGNSSNSITFNRAGSSGTWGGIVFNPGSTGTVQYCNILNAANGVTFNNTSSPVLEYCDIQNCSSNGIYLNGSSSPTLTGNTISNCNFGIYCYNYAAPVLVRNNISGNQNGIAGFMMCSPQLGSYNTITSNGNGIYLTQTTSSIIARYSNIYNNSSYALNLQDGGSMDARYNYWGYSISPYYNVNDFYTSNFALNYSNALSSFQADGLLKSVSDGSYLSDTDAELQKAYEFKHNKNYAAAEDIYKKIILSGEDKAKIYALSQLLECLRDGGKDDFIQYTGSELKGALSENNDLERHANGLKFNWMLGKGNIEEAISFGNKLRETYPEDKSIDKSILYNLGYIYLTLLNDEKTAGKYFYELQNKYPGELADIQSRLLYNDTTGIYNLFMVKSNNQSKNITSSMTISEYSLANNYPNPFNPVTEIEYQLPEDGNITLIVYDILGREVAVLVNGFRNAGKYTEKFDASSYSSGTYIYKLKTKNYTAVKKMSLIK